MRRLVLLGVMGLASGGCGVAPPEPDVVVQDQPLCPDLVVKVEQKGAPDATLSTDTAALSGAARPMLVQFRSSPSTLRAGDAPRELEARVRATGAQVRRHWPALNAMALSLTPEAQARLAADPEVLSISPDHEVHALGTVSGALGGIPAEYTPALQLTQANLVWDPDNDGTLKAGTPNGSGITVCVIDSGMDLQHPELQAAYAGGKDFVDDDDSPEDKDKNGAWGGGHGTHVAGIIAAQPVLHGKVNPNDKTLSPQGMVGAAPGVRLLIARVLGTDGGGKVSDVIEAVDWCVAQKANILSLSLGSSERSDLEEAAFKRAQDAGVLSFAASGNGGDTATEDSRIYPSAYPSVIAVGAVSNKSEHPSFSQGGPHLALVAPGVSVYSSFPRGQAPYSELKAGGIFYASSALDHVPFQSFDGKLINCGLGEGLRSCPEAACSGFVAYVTRGGGITFADKVRNVRSQGAGAVIIVNNDPKDDATLAFTLGSKASWPPVTAVPTTLSSTLLDQLGQSVHVGIEGSDYAYSTGTSMATPYASGVAALVWSAHRELKAAQVKDILTKTARFIPNPADPTQTSGRNDVFGYGLVQAQAGVKMAVETTPTK